ncbi:MAG: phospholipid/cholesterol/gamma-HCH transport system ATP-binding protein [Myxococcota bacterium]|jgi:phospholipid/cholesterol/gamma-HCH transport system ATP-binding protein
MLCHAMMAAMTEAPIIQSTNTESDASTPVIEAVDLAAGYGQKLILDGVDVAIHRDKITCIIGGSGCGKSTLMRAVIGLLPPMRGRTVVLGEDIYALSDAERSALLSRVGLMFQYGALLNSISVADNMMIPLKAHTDLHPDVMAEIIKMKLGMVHLGQSLERLPGELSGGMRKRAGLARAIILDPDLLFCDEPSAGLDPKTAAGIDTLILELKRLLGMTVVVITHELSSIEVIADRIIMLQDGKTHFHGTLEEARASTDPSLLSFFHRQGDNQQGDRRSLFHILGGRS